MEAERAESSRLAEEVDSLREEVQRLRQDMAGMVPPEKHAAAMQRRRQLKEALAQAQARG